jgi:cytochrome c
MSDTGLRGIVVAAVLTVLLYAFHSPLHAQGAGEELFAKRCGGCHSPDRDKEGPRLAGAYGRKAGSVPAFPYSDALRKSGIVWDDQTLEQWLTDPEKVVPGTDMEFRVEKPEERSQIIAWLREHAEKR